MGRRGLAGSGHDVWRVRGLRDFLDGEHCADTAAGSEGAGGGAGAGTDADMQCLAIVLSVYAADRSSGVRGSALGLSSMIPIGWVPWGPEPGG